MISNNIYTVDLPRGLSYIFSLYGENSIALSASEAANIVDMFITEVAIAHTALKTIDESVLSILSSGSLSVLIIRLSDNTVQSLLNATKDILAEFHLHNTFTTADIVTSISGSKIVIKRQGQL